MEELIMFMYIKEFVLSLLATVTIFGSYYVPSLHQAHKAQSTFIEMKKEFTTKTESLLEAIKTSFHIPESDWRKFQSDFSYIKENDTLLGTATSICTSEDPLTAHAYELCIEYGINPDAVTLYWINEPNILTNAAAEQGYLNDRVVHRLCLNEPVLLGQTSEIQDAILRHEMMHLLDYDPLQQGMIEAVLQKNGYSKSNYENHPVFINYCRCREFKADALAACKDSAVAHAFQKFFTGYLKQDALDEISCASHPSDTQRLAAINHLIQKQEIC